MASPKRDWARYFLLAMVTLLPAVSPSSYLETNDFSFAEEPKHLPVPEETLPECAPESVCAYLQANARGIHKQQMCRCPSSEEGPISCPLVWDSMDGHSITQGSDQYKFCLRAPRLPECVLGKTAYTSRIAFDQLTGATTIQADQMQCRCPSGHNYHTVRSRFVDVDANTEVMEVIYVCQPLHTCGANEACKAISENTRGTFLVNPKCRCAPGLACPTLATKGVDMLPMDGGQIRLVQCQ